MLAGTPAHALDVNFAPHPLHVDVFEPQLLTAMIATLSTHQPSNDIMFLIEHVGMMKEARQTLPTL